MPCAGQLSSQSLLTGTAPASEQVPTAVFLGLTHTGMNSPSPHVCAHAPSGSVSWSTLRWTVPSAAFHCPHPRGEHHLHCAHSATAGSLGGRTHSSSHRGAARPAPHNGSSPRPAPQHWQLPTPSSLCWQLPASSTPHPAPPHLALSAGSSLCPAPRAESQATGEKLGTMCAHFAPALSTACLCPFPQCYWVPEVPQHAHTVMSTLPRCRPWWGRSPCVHAAHAQRLGLCLCSSTSVMLPDTPRVCARTRT